MNGVNAMAKLPYFPFYPSDFDSDTQLLSDAEVGAYVRLLNIQWKKGKIPIDKLPRIMEDYESVWGEISEFFIVEDGLVFNNRLEEERVIAIGRHEKAVKANNARWNAPSNAPSNPTDDPPAIPTQNSKPITHNAEQKTQKEHKRFAPPTMDEVIKLFIEKGSTKLEAEKFFYFYESKNWMVGKVKMKSWTASVSGWIARNKAKEIEDRGYVSTLE